MTSPRPPAHSQPDPGAEQNKQQPSPSGDPVRVQEQQELLPGPPQNAGVSKKLCSALQRAQSIRDSRKSASTEDLLERSQDTRMSPQHQRSRSSPTQVSLETNPRNRAARPEQGRKHRPPHPAPAHFLRGHGVWALSDADDGTDKGRASIHPAYVGRWKECRRVLSPVCPLEQRQSVPPPPSPTPQARDRGQEVPAKSADLWESGAVTDFCLFQVIRPAAAATFPSAAADRRYTVPLRDTSPPLS